MGRYLQTGTPVARKINSVAPIALGGTGGNSELNAAISLGAVSLLTAGQPNGIAISNASGNLPASQFPSSLASGVTIDGPADLYTTQTVEFTITNFDSSTTYNVSVNIGSVVRSGSSIFITTPATVGYLTLTINGKDYNFGVWQAGAITPIVTSPINGALEVSSPVNFTSSAFATSTGTGTHQYTDWQIATDKNFTTIINSAVNDAVNKTSWQVSGLSGSTGYYVRTRHKETTAGFSQWSKPAYFVTRVNDFVNVEQAKLTDNIYNSSFGTSVSLSSDGNRVAIGAGAADMGGVTDAGAVYIFLRTGSTWAQEAVLTANDKVIQDLFGTSVALSSNADRVVVGAPWADSSGFNQNGAVYVFTRSGTTWTQETKIASSDNQNDYQFGDKVAITSDGSRIAISVPQDNLVSTLDAGAVYIYTRSGVIWTREAKLVASDAIAYDQFGTSIAITQDGTRIVIGAPFKDNGGLTDAGAAYIFIRSGATWTQEAKLEASDKALGDYFGTSVSISNFGDRVAIGSYNSDKSTILNVGSTYIFYRNTFTWAQEVKLERVATQQNAYFGRSVSLDGNGNKLLVGAPGVTSGGLAESGAVYVFSRTGTTWTQQTELTASDKVVNGLFGGRTCFSNDGSTAFITGRKIVSTSELGTGYVFTQ